MITFRPKYGRLGEIMWMTYGLFYLCIENDIPLDMIFLNRNRVGFDYYYNVSHPILENIEMFDNISWCLKDLRHEEYETRNYMNLRPNELKYFYIKHKD